MKGVPFRKSGNLITCLLIGGLSSCGGSINVASGGAVSNCVTAPSGLAAWWDGDQVSGTTVTDRSSSGNTGTATGITTTTGKVGNAFSLDGSSAQVSAAHSSSLSPTAALSVAAWVKGDTSSFAAKQQTILSKWGYNASAFTDASNATGAWAGYTIANIDYTGGIFDGRYVYFVPANAAAVVWRYDTQAAFGSAGSWQSATLTTILGANYTNYVGGAFDGRYVYLSPFATSNAYAARFDTQNGNFTATGWEGTGNLNSAAYGTLCNPNCHNYAGALFDGRYMYYIPDANAAHGNIIRYDTTGAFTTPASWTYANLQTILGASYNHYLGGAFDGRYIYLAPFGGTNGAAARYDTQSASFTTGWQGVDLDGVAGLGTNYNGFLGAVFDGRYIYYVPYQNAAFHGYTPRFDTKNGDFTSTGWEGTNIGTGGHLGNNNTGFAGGFFDGRYLYFAPRTNTSGNSGYVTRYDTTAAFGTAGSWTNSNMAGITGLSAAFVGYRGGVYDGRYIYFSPRTNGNIARFDTLGTSASYQLVYSQNNHDGWGNNLPGITFTVNTAAGYALSASANTAHAAATWTHVAGTYDGTTARLYVNGAEAASRTGASSAINSSGQAAIGNSATSGASYFAGLLDELMLFSTALSSSAIASIYNAGADGVCK